MMFSSNSVRGAGAEVDDAWSSVAVAVALADACFNKVATRTEAGLLALWKSVTMSFVLCCAD